jgi:ribosomal protein L12E/L44/L45/RPP1/RPP2
MAVARAKIVSLARSSAAKLSVRGGKEKSGKKEEEESEGQKMEEIDQREGGKERK